MKVRPMDRAGHDKVRLTGWNRTLYVLFFGFSVSVQGIALIGVGLSALIVAQAVWTGSMPNCLGGFLLAWLFVGSASVFRPLPADTFAPLPVLTLHQEQVLREAGGLSRIAKMNAQEKEAVYARIWQG